MPNKAQTLEKTVLGYWDIRGLAQPIRLLLSYVGADFEENRYRLGPAPEFHRRAWLTVKEANPYGLVFPNLPYLIDGHVRLTQTHAIMRYLARKYRLVARDDEQVERCELVEQQLSEMRSLFVRMCYSPDHDRLKVGERSLATCSALLAFGGGGCLHRLRTMLGELSRFLGERSWFAGDAIRAGGGPTYVDFLLYEILFQLMIFDQESFTGLDNLASFIKRFEALPTISTYMKSKEFIKWPFNNDIAAYGSRLQKCPF